MLLEKLLEREEELPLILTKIQACQLIPDRVNEDFDTHLFRYERARQKIMLTHHLSIFEYEIMYEFMLNYDNTTGEELYSKFKEYTQIEN